MPQMFKTIEKQNTIFQKLVIGRSIRYLTGYNHKGNETGSYSLWNARDGKEFPNIIGSYAIQFHFLSDTNNRTDEFELSLGALNALNGNWVDAEIQIEEIHGDLRDLFDSPIIQAEVVGHYFLPHDYDRETFPSDFPEWGEQKDPYYAYEWVFYKFATIKGSVTIRFYGNANYCYSTCADMLVRLEITDENERELDEQDGEV